MQAWILLKWKSVKFYAEKRRTPDVVCWAKNKLERLGVGGKGVLHQGLHHLHMNIKQPTVILYPATVTLIAVTIRHIVLVVIAEIEQRMALLVPFVFMVKWIGKHMPHFSMDVPTRDREFSSALRFMELVIPKHLQYL